VALPWYGCRETLYRDRERAIEKGSIWGLNAAAGGSRRDDRLGSEKAEVNGSQNRAFQKKEESSEPGNHLDGLTFKRKKTRLKRKHLMKGLSRSTGRESKKSISVYRGLFMIRSFA